MQTVLYHPFLLFVLLPIGIAGGAAILWWTWQRTQKCSNAKASRPAIGAGKKSEEEIVLVAAAAIHSLLGHNNLRIISIRAMGNSTWAREGRSEIFRSKHIL